MQTLTIVSGYFNPVHIGHIELLKAAQALGDKLLVIVNNDKQQLLKKGKIIIQEEERMEIARAIRYVDDVILSIDDDPTVIRTIEKIAMDYPDHRIIFANGGDRESAKVVPETIVCKKFNIKMLFDVGGTEKLNSSTNINKNRGLE
jgi:cytidyltransferase-like protein